MDTVCALNDTPAPVQEAIERWFTLGFARLDAICKELEAHD